MDALITVDVLLLSIHNLYCSFCNGFFNPGSNFYIFMNVYYRGFEEDYREYFDIYQIKMHSTVFQEHIKVYSTVIL